MGTSLRVSMVQRSHWRFELTRAVLRILVGRGACAAAWAALALGSAQAQSVSIQHDEVRCILADRFPVLEARLEPADAVARARLLFRAAGSGNWYYVEMNQDQGAFRGILPKPLKTTARIEYYIEALDRSLGQARTQDCSAAVSLPGECGPNLRLATTTLSAKVPVGSLSPGAPTLPPGFSVEGIVGLAAGGTATGAASSAVAGAATSGGGLSTQTLLGIVGAGAVAGGVAIASGSSKSDSPSTAPNVAGHWAGTYTFQTNILCDIEVDITADLTQSGANITGPGTFRTRTSARPDCGRQDLQITWNGSLGGSAITLTLVHMQCTSTMAGAVSGNTMGGTWRESGSGGCEGQTGIWNLARR